MRRDEGREDSKQRRLAAAIWTKESEDFGAGDVEADVINRDALSIALSQMLNLDGAIRHKNQCCPDMGGGLNMCIDELLLSAPVSSTSGISAQTTSTHSSSGTMKIR